MNIYTTFLYQPIFNFLVLLYTAVPMRDIGLAIIVLTIIIKIVLWPFTTRMLRAQRSLSALQPQIKEIQAKYKGDKQAQTKALMELYAREKVNPASSCLPLLLQFPILIALYQVMRDGLAGKGMELIYPFVSNPGEINPIAFGFLNLAERSIPLAVLAGAAQFWQSKMLPQNIPPKSAGSSAADEGALALMNKQMVYFMPLLTVIIGFGLPGGIMLYWLITTLITILQQWLFLRNHKRSAGTIKP